VIRRKGRLRGEIRSTLGSESVDQLISETVHHRIHRLPAPLHPAAPGWTNLNRPARFCPILPNSSQFCPILNGSERPYFA